MQLCEKCGYALGPFEKRCPRCSHVKGGPLPETEAVPVPQYQPESPPVHHIGLLLGMGSGSQIIVTDVLLHDQHEIANAIRLKSLAMQKFEGFSTGIGFIGSFGSVVTNSLILGAFENSVSNRMQQEGLQLLAHADELFERARRACYFIPPHQVSSIELPSPGMWSSEQMTPVGMRTFIHSGDPSLTVKTSEGKTISVMWDKIETYEVIPL